MPSLRRREASLRSGGWFRANNIVSRNPLLKFSNRFCLLDYEGKPGSLPSSGNDEKAMLSRRPVIVATKKADKRTKSLAVKLNRQVMDETNVLHSVLCGWPIFNRWTPPKKFLSKRWQCHFNFSVRKDRETWCFPERRFIRFISNTNKLDADLVESTTALLKIRMSSSQSSIRTRIQILNRWLFYFGNGDYRQAKPSGRRITRAHGRNTLLGKLFACRRKLLKEVG